MAGGMKPEVWTKKQKQKQKHKARNIGLKK